MGVPAAQLDDAVLSLYETPEDDNLPLERPHEPGDFVAFKEQL